MQALRNTLTKKVLKLDAQLNIGIVILLLMKSTGMVMWFGSNLKLITLRIGSKVTIKIHCHGSYKTRLMQLRSKIQNKKPILQFQMMT